jgi:ribonuclease HII
MVAEFYGMDEVGRGALAGPVVVGLVGLPNYGVVPELLRCINRLVLTDSKKLTSQQRTEAFNFLEKRISWTVGEASPSEIDEHGLTQALSIAAGRAIDTMGSIPILKVDAGLRHPYESSISTEWFIKGDEVYPEISLASIMAKVWRDRGMEEYNKLYPGYDFIHNVGYGTKKHYEALRIQGESPIHRALFLRKFHDCC